MTDTELRILLNQKLAELVDVLLLRFNPCDVREGNCRTGRLLGVPLAPCCRSRHYERFNADGSCPLLGERGCTVQDAKCKLFFCEAVLLEADPLCILALRDLEAFARRFELVSRPYLGDRYVGRAEERQARREASGQVV